MKKILGVLLVLALVLSAVSAFAEEEKVLTIYTWEEYVDYDTIARFEDETGSKVNFVACSTNEEMLLKLQNGATDYDIVIASDYTIDAMVQQGLVLELDKEKLPNWGNLNPAYLNQYYDPDSRYSMPYTAGTPMIVYDPAQVDFEINSFADLWDERLADSVCVLDDARVTIGAVLKMLGYSYNTTDADQLAQAEERLNALRPNIRMFAYDAAASSLLGGECSVAYMFTPYVAICLLDNPDLIAVNPSEGIGYGIDNAVIPAASRHPENAHMFLNYLMDAEVAAGVAAYQYYINPNGAADPVLKEIAPELEALNCFHIPEELYATKEFVEYLGENESLYQDIWTRFKLG